MPEINKSHDYTNDFYQALDRCEGQLNQTPLLKGAVDALRYLGAKIDETILTDEIRRAFSTGSDPEMAIGYFIGVMRTAPELVLRIPLLIDMLNQLLSEWDEGRFIQVLPDLRFAFSQLTPKQNAQMAQYVAQDMAIEAKELTLHQTEFNEQQMMEVIQLEQQLQSQLIELGLQDWFARAQDDK